MHGIGRNQVGGHHGRMLMKCPCQSLRKPISCVTSILPTSSKHSKVWSPRGGCQISLRSSGEISLQTSKLTSVSWLKINMPDLPHMIPPLTLGTMLSSPPSLGQNQKPKLKMTHNGILHGQNIQQWFYLPIHIGETSSINTANISLASSSPTLTPFSALNMILLPGNSSMDTKTSPMLTSVNFLTCPLKSTCHRDSREVLGEKTGASQALVRVPKKEGVRGSTFVVH